MGGVGLNISPKLFRLTADICGLDSHERVRVFNASLCQLRKTQARLGENGDCVSGSAGSLVSIYESVLLILLELRKMGTPEKTINYITICGFAPILFYFAAKSQVLYDKELLDDFCAKMISCYEEGKFSKGTYWYFRKAAKVICDMNSCSNGSSGIYKVVEISLGRTRRQLNEHNEHMLLLYASKIGNYRPLSEMTIKRCSSCIRAFLHHLEQRGVFSVNEYTHSIISDAIVSIEPWYDGGLGAIIYSVAQFLELLHEESITKVDFSLAIPKTSPRRRRIYQGFSCVEKDSILDSVDTDCPKGKRDFAIMILAAETGLRAIDIANLKLEDIDWYSNEIKLVQTKTGNPLSLPLMPNVGNAIADYILNARPNSYSRNVFNYHKREGRLQGQTIGAVVKKYANLSGTGVNHKRIGVHNFRRGFGKGLLEAKIPIDMINQLLGHTQTNSSRPYLSIDELGLKNCAISLSHIDLGDASDLLPTKGHNET